MYLGTGYEHFPNFTKRIEHAVVLQMKDTCAYCLPDFIKKGITVFFAINNNDFLEVTQYGLCTLHGCVLVVNQEDENAEPINPPLDIPDKSSSKPPHVDIKDEAVIQLTPIKFTSHKIGHTTNMMRHALWPMTLMISLHQAVNHLIPPWHPLRWPKQ